ncbi:MAG: 4'-phosphopantetheinyl transferase superfamily protein [Culturomica sp.]|jgi:4'-phosphopantetheinyl transferase|nr:4'-phosphopantetheinyl transferase superfamily protein [Culturomica sp.]
MLKILLHNINETGQGASAEPDFFRWADSETLWEAGRYRNSRSRYCRVAGNAMARYGLSAFFGLPPEQIRILRGEKGKPFAAGRRDLHFNISHSGAYIVCAFSDREVGIDTERIREARLSVARRFFHPDEMAALEETPAELKNERFFRYWSIKEAFLKYTGTGLTRPLSSFRITESESGIALYEAEQKIEVTLREYRFDPEYTCFVCSGSRPSPFSTEQPFGDLDRIEGGAFPDLIAYTPKG